MNIISFYEKAKGSSHKSSGKPCQDYGLSYENNGVYIAIVCDGHGGDSYVRSDKGAKLAAEIAFDKILEFIESLPDSFFTDKEGSVTVIPTVNPLKDNKGNKIDFSALSESQQEIVRQNKAYFDNSNKHPQIESRFRTLFKEIVDCWRDTIQEDSKTEPFSDIEKEKLGLKRLEKAYGTTLMAAVRTPKYWFAFHIGDGKLLVCDNLLKWTEPVPWDYNCFLNVTTSLCDVDPVNEFRYAFNGTGQFPMAFALGSDGIDDTFVSSELLIKFYSQMLCVFNEYSKDEALSFLQKHLPVLSEKGSHDDMSVAAIIDTTNLSLSIKYYNILLEAKKLKLEKLDKENTLYELQRKIDKLNQYKETLLNERDEFSKQAWKKVLDFMENRHKDKEEIERKKTKCNENETMLKQLKAELESTKDEFNVWNMQGKIRIDNLKADAQRIEEMFYPHIIEKKENIESTVNLDKITIQNKVLDESSEIVQEISSPMSQKENELWDNESEKQVKKL